MELYSIIYYLLIAIASLIGLSLVVAIHEFGHLIFAKLFGVLAPSFSIGFGPKLCSIKIGETEYSISAIPLGGYVEIAGNAEVGQGEQNFANLSAKDPRSLTSKPYWQKMLIMFGGILFNFISAFIVISSLYFSGAPCISQMCSKDPAVIKSVDESSEAYKSGLKSEDKIIKINETETNSIEKVKVELEKFIDKEINLTILRNGKEESIKTTVGSQEISGKRLPRLGIVWQSEPRSFKEAIADGLNTTWDITKQVTNSIKNLLSGKKEVRSQIGGPILLIYQIIQSFGQGMKIFLFLLAAISINLAVFNVLPLPIFDGGQALFYTIEAILGRPLSEATREKIHQFTWLFVLALMILLSFSDITKLFKLK